MEGTRRSPRIEFFPAVAGEQDRMCCETGALMIVPPNALHALRNNTSQRGRLLGIGGSFDVKTRALSGSLTASASGSLAFDESVTVDLRPLDTGIGLRNERASPRNLPRGR